MRKRKGKGFSGNQRYDREDRSSTRDHNTINDDLTCETPRSRDDSNPDKVVETSRKKMRQES